MPGIDVVKYARNGIVFAKEKGDEPITGGGIVDDAVKPLDEPGQIERAAEGKSMQSGTDGSHQQGGRDTFAGDVTDGDTEAAVFEGDKVVIVPANLLRSTAVACKIKPRDDGIDLGQKALLHLARDFDFALDALALR